MKPIFLIIVFSLFSLCFSEENVVEITDVNFEQTAYNSPVLMVLFCHPSHPPCSDSISNLEKAAEISVKGGKTHVFGSYDLSKNRDLAERLHAMGAPKFIIYFKGRIINYEGRQTAVAMVEFLDHLMAPPKQLKTLESVKKLINSTGLRVRAFSKNRRKIVHFDKR